MKKPIRKAQGKKTLNPSAFSLSFTFAMVLAITTMTGISIGQSMLQNGHFTAQITTGTPDDDDEGTGGGINTGTSSSASSRGDGLPTTASSSSAGKYLPPAPITGQSSSSIPTIAPAFYSSSSSFDGEEYRKRMEAEAERTRAQQEEAARRASEQMQESMRRNTGTGNSSATTQPAPGTPLATGCYDATGAWTQDVTKCDWQNQRTHYENAQEPATPQARPNQPVAPAPTQNENEVEVLVENRFVEQKRAELLTTITEGQQRLSSLLAARILPAASVSDAQAVHDWLMDMYAYYLKASVTLDDLQVAGTNVYDALAQIQVTTESIRTESPAAIDPRLEYIVSRLQAIVDTIPSIVAIFQREKLPVSFDMLNAYVQAEDLLQRSISEGCPQKESACTKLNNVIEKLQITSDAIKKTLDEKGTDAIRREVEGL